MLAGYTGRLEFGVGSAYRPVIMIHENLSASIESLAARMIAIRDSL